MSHWLDDNMTQEEFDSETEYLKARAASGWPPFKPPVAIAASDDDPLDRLASEINKLSQPDAKRLLKMLEERI